LTFFLAGQRVGAQDLPDRVIVNLLKVLVKGTDRIEVLGYTQTDHPVGDFGEI
jgi:hypothetical protein